MDLIVSTKLLRQTGKMLDRSKPIEPMIDQRMSKPLCPHHLPEKQPFPRMRPEEKGVSSRHIAAFLNAVAEDPSLDIHGIFIVRDGAVICDAAFGAYDSSYYHVCHSLSKSVTATAIGMLIDEGKLSLDDRVVKLLEKKISPLAQLAYKNLTVRHLLTMSSGSAFNEASILVEKHWLRAYFESIPRFEPGKKFQYNSLNSYILACLVKELTGQGLCEYLKPRLLDPLGITVYHWEKSPEEIEVGGWGLYLRREDAAKLGQLYLDGGMWHQKRLLSERWVRIATTSQIQTPENTGAFHYGLHFWSGRRHHCFLMNGMFGQDVLVLPKTRTVIVTNGGIEQLFQQSSYYELLFRYFYALHADPPRKRDRRGEAELRSALDRISLPKKKRHLLSVGKGVPSYLSETFGRTYTLPPRDPEDVVLTESVNGLATIGLMPFVEQVLRNGYTKGIRSFSFEEGRDEKVLVVTEGNGRYRLPFRLGQTTRTVLTFAHTEYHVAVTASAARDEDGRGVLKLRISFPEVASARLLKIYFEKNSIEVRMSEMPGMGLATLFVREFERSLRGRKGMTGMVSLLDTGAILCKIERLFSPSFRLSAEDQR